MAYCKIIEDNIVRDGLSSTIYKIKSKTHEEFVEERAYIKRAYSKNRNFYATILLHMFRKEIKLVGEDLQKLDNLVSIYVQDMPYDIKTDEDKKNKEILLGIIKSKGLFSLDTKQEHVWHELSLEKQCVFMDAYNYLDSITDARIQDSKHQEKIKLSHKYAANIQWDFFSWDR